MAAYHILIVDNQRKQRRDLRSSIESLGPDFKVTDVLSGEEAILLLTQQPIHLLVSEFRLAGMTGLELMHKVRQRQPDVKTIFIADASQDQIRTQAVEAGADAYFFKPVDTTGFLKAVERCLGLADAEPPKEPETQAEPPKTSFSIPEILDDLRQQVQALAVLLMDRDGRVAAQAGNLPADSDSLQAALKASLDAGVKISWAMGKLPPEDLTYFSGIKYDLYLTHVGQSTALVVLTEPVRDAERRGKIALHLQPAVNALLHGFSTRERTAMPQAEGSSKPSVSTSSVEEGAGDPKLDSLLSQASRSDLPPKEMDDYWETAAQQAAQNAPPKAGVLSYEQARKLGLTPKDDVKS